MRTIRAALAAAACLGAGIPIASADCICRAPGFVAHHGEVVCLKTAAGPRLARCGMAQNNASWIVLPESCPEASRHLCGKARAMSCAAAVALR